MLSSRLLLTIPTTLAVFITLTAFIGISPANAATVRVTDNQSDDQLPQVDGGKVVWTGNSDGDYEVYLYDIATKVTTQLTNNTVSDGPPQISEGKIAWGSAVGLNSELFLYDIATATTTQITNDGKRKEDLLLSDGKMIWQVIDGTEPDLYLYDIANQTTVRLTDNDESDGPPYSIEDGKIAWRGNRQGDRIGAREGLREVFLYDVATAITTQITNNDVDDTLIKIEDGKVIWERAVSEGFEIYSYDIATQAINKIITLGPNDRNVGIDNGKLLWRNEETYLYDIATQSITQVTNNESKEYNVRIKDGKVIWFDEISNPTGNDLYVYDIAHQTTTQLSSTAYRRVIPQLDNGIIVWTESDGSDFEIFLSDMVGERNQAPVLEPIGDKTIGEGELLEFTLNATDPEGNNLTYSAANLPEGATFNPQTRTFSWTPTFEQEGTYPNIEFTVTDDGSPLELDTELIAIYVGNVNRPPVFDPVGPQEVLVGQQLSFTLNVLDPDGNSFTLSAENLPAGASFDPGTGAFSWTPASNQSGDYVVTFSATDDGDTVAVGTLEVPVTVGNNQTPTEQAEELVDIVVDYDLPNNVENSYLSNLKKVVKFIEDGKIQPAINQLNAFINKVNSDYSQGVITQAIRNDLVNRAEALIADLQ